MILYYPDPDLVPFAPKCGFAELGAVRIDSWTLRSNFDYSSVGVFGRVFLRLIVSRAYPLLFCHGFHVMKVK